MVHSNWVVGAVAVLACAVAVPAFSADGKTKIAPLRKEANAAIAEMSKALRKQLVAAMKEGGPANAIGVCKTVAPTIAADQSEKTGMTVRRTALKVRNPNNAPDDFERKTLEKFVAEVAAGKDVRKLRYAEIVETDDGKVFRYMRGIPTSKLCLRCHGEAVGAKVKSEIGKLYPNDQATGFMEGELRGAFSISKKL